MKKSCLGGFCTFKKKNVWVFSVAGIQWCVVVVVVVVFWGVVQDSLRLLLCFIAEFCVKILPSLINTVFFPELIQTEA